MPASETVEKQPSDIGIFARMLSNGRPMTPDLARYVLTLGFSESDQVRMQDLSSRNQQGELSPAEQEELMAFVRASHLLALLHSTARQALNKKVGR
jgi:hypothetical protein